MTINPFYKSFFIVFVNESVCVKLCSFEVYSKVDCVNMYGFLYTRCSGYFKYNTIKSFSSFQLVSFRSYRKQREVRFLTAHVDSMYYGECSLARTLSFLRQKWLYFIKLYTLTKFISLKNSGVVLFELMLANE